MQIRNVFSGPYLDRASHLRHDAAWFAAALDDAQSRVVPVWNSRNLVAGAGAADADVPHAAFLTLDQIPSHHRNAEALVLLGRAGNATFFAYDMESVEPPGVPDGAHFEDLRTIASLLPAEEAGLLGYGRAMVSWRRRHRFCGSCGFATLSAKGGHVLVCGNPACRHEQFPRLDPAIIVLISDGDRALLGRQASWPVGRYSTIAGFVEPGESLEDAVAREVFEETGIKVDGIAYHSSQPWPFPASLMLGFTAHAVTHAVQRHDEELEDARWFTRSDVAAGALLLPPHQSISYRLIEQWFDAGHSRPLREIHPSLPWPQPQAR